MCLDKPMYEGSAWNMFIRVTVGITFRTLRRLFEDILKERFDRYVFLSLDLKKQSHIFVLLVNIIYVFQNNVHCQ